MKCIVYSNTVKILHSNKGYISLFKCFKHQVFFVHIRLIVQARLHVMCANDECQNVLHWQITKHCPCVPWLLVGMKCDYRAGNSWDRQRRASRGICLVEKTDAVELAQQYGQYNSRRPLL